MVLQGQEERETKLGAQTPAELPHLTIPADSNWDQRLLGLENQLCLPMHDQFYRCDRNTVSSPGGNIVAPCPTYQWRPIFTRDGVCDNVAVRGNISGSNFTTSNSGTREFRASESRDETEAPVSQPIGCASYMLFGINLVNSHTELPSPQVATYYDHLSPCSFPPTSQFVLLNLSRFQRPLRVSLAVFKRNNVRILVSLTEVAKRYFTL